MRLAYFSPLNPKRSGISDYSEELLPYLARWADIDLFVEGFVPGNERILSRFRWIDYKNNAASLERLAEYDAVVYHMGNDHRYHAGILKCAERYSGIVVFHDFALQDFFLGLARAERDMRIYLDETYYCHGLSASIEAGDALDRGLLPLGAANPTAFPLNTRLAARSEGIIVHSEWSRSRFTEIVPGVPVVHIDMPILDRSKQRVYPVKSSNGRDCVNIASFGLITPGKGIEQALKALSSLGADHRFHYTLVGEPNDFYDVRALIRAHGLEDRVTITGRVSLEEFERRIRDTDVALNLRERTVGETSASLCRIMAAGVPAVVMNAGWYSELPDDAVVKIDADECTGAMLQAHIKELIEDGSFRTRIGLNARRYSLEKHDFNCGARAYISFIRQVMAERPRRKLLDIISAELAALGPDITDDEEFMQGVAREISGIAPPSLPKSPENGNMDSHPSSEDNSEEGQARAISGSHESNPASNFMGRKGGRMRKLQGIDYKLAAIEYPARLDSERRHYLLTKPFYNLANKPDKHQGGGMDFETHRHLCDFANIAVALELAAGKSILDVGCGSGWLSEYFARLGYRVTGIDISPELIQTADVRLKQVGFQVDHQTDLRCEFKVHDVEETHMNQLFDAIICYDSLHHFEDERSVIANLAAMLGYGGLLFIVEGAMPEEGSATEEELVGVMHRFGTLESPLSREYLHEILNQRGFAVVGDYVTVNGLFERDLVKSGTLAIKPEPFHYFLCKKVNESGLATAVPTSMDPGVLLARMEVTGSPVQVAAPRAPLAWKLMVENTGDTVWLGGSNTRRGVVMLGIKVLDQQGTLIDEFHGQPSLPRAVAPRERIELDVRYEAPTRSGRYTIKIDLVDQHITWFEAAGSRPLYLELEVGAEQDVLGEGNA